MGKKILLPFLILILASCATVQDLDKARSEGKAVTASFDYNWESVYDVMRLVVNNVEDGSICFESASCSLEYKKEDRRIWLNMGGFGTGAGIYFVPLSDSKTKVEFVRTGFNRLFLGDEEIKFIIEKSLEILKSSAHDSRC